MALLAGLGQNVKDAMELGRKFAIVETARVGGRKGGLGMLGMGMGMGMGHADWDGDVGMDYQGQGQVV